MTSTTLTQEQVRQIRLHSSLLYPGGHDGVTTAADVAEHFVALQGQDWVAARLALGVRAPGATRASIDAEFTAGRLVRSWPMRGTLHVVAARDLGWVQALTNDRVMRDAPKRRATIGLELALVEKAAAVAREALAGGGAMTRDELLSLISDAGVPLVAQQRYHTIWHLAQTGVLVFGPVRDGQHLLVLADEWIKEPRWFDGDAALVELFRAYVRGHGPCTPEDFSWWTKLSVPVSRKAAKLAAATYRDELVAVDVAGVENWVSATAREAALTNPVPHGTALLLPGFDELYLGLRDRSAHVSAEFSPRLAPGNNGIFKAAVLLDGEIVGTWKSEGNGVDVTPQIDLFGDIHRPNMGEAIERYRAFLRG